jgi:hypothetical protein
MAVVCESSGFFEALAEWRTSLARGKVSVNDWALSRGVDFIDASLYHSRFKAPITVSHTCRLSTCDLQR